MKGFSNSRTEFFHSLNFNGHQKSLHVHERIETQESKGLLFYKNLILSVYLISCKNTDSSTASTRSGQMNDQTDTTRGQANGQASTTKVQTSTTSARVKSTKSEY